VSDARTDRTGVQPPRAEEPAAAEHGAEVRIPTEAEPREAAPESSAETAESSSQPDSEGGVEAGAEPSSEPVDEPEPEDELSQIKRERDDYLGLAQRTQADFENYRKRAAKETAAAGRRARSGLIGELLPVVDNLERALASAGEQEEHLADGVRLVHSELVAVLARNGVEQFDPAGQKFDPSFHEALSTREADGAEPGVVLDVVEKGYKLNGTVLRPARVVVSG
jgi:molecular chaperone GrpE